MYLVIAVAFIHLQFTAFIFMYTEKIGFFYLTFYNFLIIIDNFMIFDNNNIS